jgi:hypothetical protein
MLSMRFLPNTRFFSNDAAPGTSLFPRESAAPDVPADAQDEEETSLLKTIGWVSAALGAVAIGMVIGREIRQRYKFNRRTPYDLYAHSSDEINDVEFGVGI